MGFISPGYNCMLLMQSAALRKEIPSQKTLYLDLAYVTISCICAAVRLDQDILAVFTRIQVGSGKKQPLVRTRPFQEQRRSALFFTLFFHSSIPKGTHTGMSA